MLSTSQAILPQPIVPQGIVVTQVQDLALGLVQPHTVVLSLLIQSVST